MYFEDMLNCDFILTLLMGSARAAGDFLLICGLDNNYGDYYNGHRV